MKQTLAMNGFRPSRLTPKSALALLIAAAAAWFAVYQWMGLWDPAHDHVEAGRNYVRMGNPQQAVQEWREAVRVNPNSMEAWELLGEYYMSLRDWKEAAEALRNLARLQPDAPHIYTRLASCAFKAGDPWSALRGAEDAIKRDPNDVGALAIAAKLLSTLDDERKHLTYLRQLVKLRPDDMDFLVLLARTLTNAHLYDEAAPLIERMLKLDPDSADAYGLRGRRWLDTGTSPQDYARAEADFQKALQLNPGGPMPHLHLGRLYLMQGQTDRSIAHLEQAARLLPNQPEVFFTLAAAYTRAQQPGKAADARRRFAAIRQQQDMLSALEKRCAVSPDDFEDHLQMGLLALDKGDYDRADYFLRRAQILRPGDTRSQEALRRLAALTNEAAPVDGDMASGSDAAAKGRP